MKKRVTALFLVLVSAFTITFAADAEETRKEYYFDGSDLTVELNRDWTVAVQGGSEAQNGALAELLDWTVSDVNSFLDKNNYLFYLLMPDNGNIMYLMQMNQKVLGLDWDKDDFREISDAEHGYIVSSMREAVDSLEKTLGQGGYSDVSTSVCDEVVKMSDGVYVQATISCYDSEKVLNSYDCYMTVIDGYFYCFYLLCYYTPFSAEDDTLLREVINSAEFASDNYDSVAVNPAPGTDAAREKESVKASEYTLDNGGLTLSTDSDWAVAVQDGSEEQNGEVAGYLGKSTGELNEILATNKFLFYAVTPEHNVSYIMKMSVSELGLNSYIKDFRQMGEAEKEEFFKDFINAEAQNIKTLESNGFTDVAVNFSDELYEFSGSLYAEGLMSWRDTAGIPTSVKCYVTLINSTLYYFYYCSFGKDFNAENEAELLGLVKGAVFTNDIYSVYTGENEENRLINRATAKIINMVIVAFIAAAMIIAVTVTLLKIRRAKAVPPQDYPLYPDSQYPNQQYPNQQYPNQQYPNQQYPNQQYPNQQYPNQQ